jgi:hypothetical protein
MDTLDTQKRKMLAALEASLGVVSTACTSANVPRSTHYNWLNTDTAYREAVAELEAAALDFAESKLLELIGAGNATAILFYLKCKGRGRGYVERPKDNPPAFPGEIRVVFVSPDGTERDWDDGPPDTTKHIVLPAPV